MASGGRLSHRRGSCLRRARQRRTAALGRLGTAWRDRGHLSIFSLSCVGRDRGGPWRRPHTSTCIAVLYKYLYEVGRHHPYASARRGAARRPVIERGSSDYPSIL